MSDQLTPLISIIRPLCSSRKLGLDPRLCLFGIYKPCSFSVYSRLLRLCASLKFKKWGQLIHSRLILDGIPVNTCLSNGLVMFYSKVGAMESARKVFDHIPDKRVVSWTVLISGYYKNGDTEETLRTFSEMHLLGVRANQFTYGSVLSACASLLCLKRGKQIHGCAQKSRFVDNLFVQSALIDLYSKIGMIGDACYVFESMEKRDLVSWNTIIGGYVLQKLSGKAIVMFQLMLEEGMTPDSFSFGYVLKASVGKLRIVSVVHGYIIQFGFESHKYVFGSLVDAYVKCGSTPSAHKVYKRIQHKDIISSTALITGYARECTNSTVALELFNDVHRNMKIDNILLCSMLNICANTASLCLGRQLHAAVLKHQNKYDNAILNSLIHMYAKSGVIEDAKVVFDEIDVKNTISWTSMITAYGRNGYGHEAVALYEKMRAEGVKPNDVTFLSILFACSHNGLTMKGLECFENMINNQNLFPKAKHYSCLVDLFARAGHLDEAYNLICKMPIDLNASALGALLGSCSTYRNLGLGEIAAKCLLNMEPHNPVNHLVLSSMYAAVDLWDRAREARVFMQEKRNVKCPGYALLPVYK